MYLILEGNMLYNCLPFFEYFFLLLKMFCPICCVIPFANPPDFNYKYSIVDVDIYNKFTINQGQEEGRS